MSKRMWAVLILQLILWGIVGILLYSYASKEQEQPFLTILAPVGGATAQRVFAQFTATQTLHWNTTARITKLIIPMYIPGHAEQIKIDLYQNNKLLTWWKYPSNQHVSYSPSTQYVTFPFIVPTELSDDLKVVFDGTTIPYTDQAFAPGFFVEDQDSNYPNGNYSIANNQKIGDIGMQFISQETNNELFWDRIHREPLGVLSMLLIFGSGFLLLSYIPILSTNLGGALVSKIRK